MSVTDWIISLFLILSKIIEDKIPFRYIYIIHLIEWVYILIMTTFSIEVKYPCLV